MSVKVTKHSTIPCVRYTFLLCNSNFILSLGRAVFLIFDFKKCRDLEIGSEVIESGTVRKIVYGFLLVFFSNIVPKTHSF